MFLEENASPFIAWDGLCIDNMLKNNLCYHFLNSVAIENKDVNILKSSCKWLSDTIIEVVRCWFFRFSPGITSSGYKRQAVVLDTLLLANL